VGIRVAYWVMCCAPMRGKMKPQAYLRVVYLANLYIRRTHAPLGSFRDCHATEDCSRRVTSRVAPGLMPGLILFVFPLLCLGPEKLLGQQPLAPSEGWSQNHPYARQYSPDQQSDFGRQQYANPPSYGYQTGYVPQSQYPTQPYPDPGDQYPQSGYGTGQPSARALNTEQLEQLVAPIALYPDTLVAQVLAAATYPAQVVDADHWRQAQGYASPDQIASGADAQSWDPSLKALTAFPQVLAEMDQNLRWTIALGNAYYNQPQDVLDVVQVMRQRAQTAGNLQSNSQEAVSYDQGYIQVAPANPEVVYLPAYNPWTVYGEPVQPYRGFSLVSTLGSFFGSDTVRYGLGIAMSAFSHTSFGWLGWGLDWLTHSLLFQNSNYYSHSTTVADWGLPHGGPRAAFQRGSFAAGSFNNSFRPHAPGTFGQRGADSRGYGAYNGYNSPPGIGRPRPVDRDTQNRRAQDFYRGNQSSGTGYARPPAMAYNRMEAQPRRPQPSSGFGYGSGFRNSPEGGYGARPNPIYNPPQQIYRSPGSGFQRGEFGGRSHEPFGGRGFEGYSGKPPKSAGFHSFGGSHEPKYSSREPKISHGHSEKGGHSGGFFGGKHHR
jgi:hypothetical protein